MATASTIETAAGDPCRRLLSSYHGVPTGQWWSDFYLWELVLNDQPELEAIFEIGTWQGGFSRYLAGQARAREMTFRTYDVAAPFAPPPHFIRMDVFAEAEALGKVLGENEPLILLCDGGNKPRELRTFTPYLHEGSVVVVHDWLTEVQPADVPDRLSPVYESFCDDLGSMSRVFEVAA